MANLIKKTKVKAGEKPIVYVRAEATKEDLQEVARLVELGWVSKPIKSKKEEIPHDITKEFNIDFDKARKEDMVKFIKEFYPDDLKDFAVEAHKNSKGEVVMVKKTENGKEKEVPKYFHLNAKRYFYKKYFENRWKEIESMLEARNFKNKKKKEANAMEDELLGLL